jgi:hypothetical protein
VTPVSAEALGSLQDLILKQDAHALDETSKQSLKRHLQRFAKATRASFAKLVLQEDQIQFLTTINNEAKVRRSTKSLVLGTAKVMSYEDLEEARAKRAAKDAMKGKVKRGRKRKSAALEADEPEAEPEEPEVAHAAEKVITEKRKRARKRKSAVQEGEETEPEQEVAHTIDAPEPWRAPVARMY